MDTGASSVARGVAGLLRVLALALGVATLAARAGTLGWPFELFTHFQWQYCVAAVLLAAVAALLRLGRVAVLASVLALLNAWSPGPAPSAPSGRNDCQGPTLELVSVNVGFRNADPARLLAWLRSVRPDVLAIQELTPAWAAALREALPWLPHGLVLPRTDAYGIAVLSRWPLTEAASVDLAGDGLPSLQIRMQVEGMDLRLLNLHTRWPMTPHLHRLRDATLDAAAERARAAGPHALLVGDLNLSPQSPAFARLLAGSGLRDAVEGRGWRPTWMAGVPPLALRIDHVLVPPDACVLEVGVGPGIGSDHRPLHVRLRLR